MPLQIRLTPSATSSGKQGGAVSFLGVSAFPRLLQFKKSGYSRKMSIKMKTVVILSEVILAILLAFSLIWIRSCGIAPKDKGSPPSPECTTEGEVRKASCPSGQIGNPLEICKAGKWKSSFNDCKASGCAQTVFDRDLEPIIASKCVSCHPGFDKIDTARSKIDSYVAKISLGDNDPLRMPKAPNAPLAPSDKKVFTDWKAGGLLPSCPATTTNIPFQHLSDLELALTKDIATQSPGLQSETRWLVALDRTNEGTNAEQFATFQKAIQKGINIISSGRNLILAADAGVSGAVLRFNLNDLKLTNAAWTLIENADPINLESFTNLGAALKNITRTRKPWLFVSAFNVAANTAAVYHAIHKIPADLNTFLGQLGINENVQLGNFQALQVGFANSPISLNKNRLLARFDSNDGALWQTFDTNGTVSADRNFFNFPLLKSSSGKATAKFDASELLFSLPNGLLGSALFDAAGKRLDAAALNVVAFDTHPPADPTIKNSPSCHQCHNGGLIPRKDEIAASVNANAAQFDLRDVDLVNQLFRDPAAAFAADNAQVAASLSKLGILPQDPDPITATIQNLTERTLDAKAVGALLLLTEEEFKAGLNTSAQGKAQVGQLLTGGAVTFQQLQATLPILIKDLRIAVDPLNP